MGNTKRMYIPRELLDELEETQMNFKIYDKNKCFKLIAENSKKTRELNNKISRDIRLNFTIDVNNMFKKRKR
jgi:hypothetical protein